MRQLTGTLLAVAASTMLTGCLATQSQLKHSSDVQSQQLAQTNAALTSERSERASSDSALAQQLGMVRGDVAQLRTDLQTMRQEFGAKIAMMEDGLHFAFPVNFAFNDAAVRTQDEAALARFSNVVQKYYPGSKVTIEGFADPAGSARYNAVLSKRRAESVRDYLTKNGLTGNELGVVGYGETRQVATGASRDMPGAELNRRVVFVIESKGQTNVAMATPEHE
jgi:outer membrane protein OmpA-like peptidoglycan-associated protein